MIVAATFARLAEQEAELEGGDEVAVASDECTAA